MRAGIVSVVGLRLVSNSSNASEWRARGLYVRDGLIGGSKDFNFVLRHGFPWFLLIEFHCTF